MQLLSRLTRTWITVAACVLVLAAQATAGEKIVAGWLEKVRIGEKALVFHAKLDTGARHSSLNATNIEMFQRDGRQWVRFSVTDRNQQYAVLEKEVERVAEIKMRSGTLQQRPVVLMPICLGPVVKEVEVNLVDRSFFNYQVLIGRSYMKGAVIVDPDAKYLHKPTACGMRPAK